MTPMKAMLAAAALAAFSAAGADYPVLPFVTRTDGTVYHGNDANRAVTTNWQSQIVPPAARPVPPGAADSDFSTIDLLFVYDKPSADWARSNSSAWNGASALEVFTAKAVAKMNEIICTTDMDTNFWFRMVGVSEVDVDGGTVKEILQKAGSRSGGYELVGEMRDRLGADIIVCVAAQSGGFGGLAPVNDYSRIMADNTVEAESCIASVLVSYSQTLAWVHEIGHLMSLNHYPPAGFDPAVTWRGLGFLNKKSEADGHVFSSVMSGGYGNFCGGFSSLNHIYHGSLLSLSNHLDSTGVMLDVARHIANWRETAVPETNELSFYPRAGSLLSGDTEFKLSHPDPQARIFYQVWGVHDSFVEYEGPFTVPASLGYAYITAYAETNGVKATGSPDPYVYLPQNALYDSALGSPGVPVGTAGSENGAWTAIEGGDGMEASGYSAPGKKSRCILSTAVRGPAVLKFKHCEKIVQQRYDWLVNSSFSVWVDSSPAFAARTPVDNLGDWQEVSVTVPDGYHAVDFVFTRRNTFTAEETARIKELSVDRAVSTDPQYLTLTGGAVPELLRWSTADWRDQDNLRYAGSWNGLEIPVAIASEGEITLSADVPVSPQYLMATGQGLLTLRGGPLEFSGPVALYPNSLIALDASHVSGVYSLMAGAGLGGSGEVSGGAVSVAAGAYLFGTLQVDNLSLYGGSFLGSPSRASANTVRASLEYAGDGIGGEKGVSVSNGVFTVGAAADVSGFETCPLLAVAAGSTLSLQGGLKVENATLYSQDPSVAVLRVSPGAALEASQRIDFMAPNGATVELRTLSGDVPAPGRYLVARAPEVTWPLESLMKIDVAAMLNMLAPAGVSFSMDRSDGDSLYATVAPAEIFDAAEGTPVPASGALDGAYVNIEVVNADSLRQGDSATILEADSISGTVPNAVFSGSRTAEYSSAVEIEGGTVKLIRTAFKFSTADGTVAFDIPLEWADRCVEAFDGDAMDAMRSANAYGVAPWQAYLLGFAPEEAAGAKLEADIVFDGANVSVALAGNGREARAASSVEVEYALLQSSSPGGEFAEAARGASPSFSFERGGGEAGFYKVRAIFNGRISLDSDTEE